MQKIMNKIMNKVRKDEQIIQKSKKYLEKRLEENFIMSVIQQKKCYKLRRVKLKTFTSSANELHYIAKQFLFRTTSS